MRLVTLATLALSCGAAAQLACGAERTPAASSAQPEVTVAPAHESPDPRPAIPVVAEHDAAAGPSIDGGASTAVPAGADRVVAALRKKFRACHQRGLVEDPRMQGRVVLSAKVSAEGTVVAVTSGIPEGLSPRVVACVEDALKTARFASAGTVQVPVAFKGEGSRSHLSR